MKWSFQIIVSFTVWNNKYYINIHRYFLLQNNILFFYNFFSLFNLFFLLTQPFWFIFVFKRRWFYWYIISIKDCDSSCILKNISLPQPIVFIFFNQCGFPFPIRLSYFFVFFSSSRKNKNMFVHNFSTTAQYSFTSKVPSVWFAYFVL